MATPAGPRGLREIAQILGGEIMFFNKVPVIFLAAREGLTTIRRRFGLFFPFYFKAFLVKIEHL